MDSAASRSIPFVHSPAPYVVNRARSRKSKPGVSTLCEPRRLAAGETLFTVGSVASGPYRVLEGAIMVLRVLPGGRRQILDIAGRGRTFGFNAGDRRDCDAIALAPAVVAPLGSDRNAQSAAMLAEIERLRELVILLASKTALERTASFLIGMIGDGAEAPCQFDLPVTRQEIADYLGLVVETVSRNFVALKKRGIIASIGRDDVEILDLDALRRIAEGHEAEPSPAVRTMSSEA